MGRKKKSSFEYEADLNKLIREFHDENIDIDTVKEAFDTNRNSAYFLKKMIQLMNLMDRKNNYIDPHSILQRNTKRYVKSS